MERGFQPQIISVALTNQRNWSDAVTEFHIFRTGFCTFDKQSVALFIHGICNDIVKAFVIQTLVSIVWVCLVALFKHWKTFGWDDVMFNSTCPWCHILKKKVFVENICCSSVGVLVQLTRLEVGALTSFEPNIKVATRCDCLDHVLPY